MSNLKTLTVLIDVEVIHQDEHGVVAKMTLSGPVTGNRTIESYNVYPLNMAAYPSEEVCP